MKPLRISLLGLVLLAIALPAGASAAKTKRCEGIGETITKLRSKGQPCDTARTLAAKWADTHDPEGKKVRKIDGYRCIRSNPPGPGGKVRCSKDDGAKFVSFRYKLL